MIVVADDFTGAAEIAALGFAQALSARVRRLGEAAPAIDESGVGLTVFDTDSRLLDAAGARRSVARLASVFTSQTLGSFVFKKTDSILRGNVVAEIAEMLRLTGKRRALLLPANPSLGRVICDRVYRIDGTPLEETEFAHDPHHPAQSSDPIELLGPSPELPIAYCRRHDALPNAGIAVCEANSAADAQAWARRLGAEDLPAGGRDFFEAILQAQAPVGLDERRAEIAYPSALLFVQGSRSPQAHALRRALEPDAQAVFEIDPRELIGPLSYAAALRERLTCGIAAAASSGRCPILAVGSSSVASEDLPRRIQTAFGQIAAQLRRAGQISHFLIEGGATASAILDAMAVESLRVVQVWAPGVATLAAEAFSRDAVPCLFTTKPGSYAWPDNLIAVLCPRRQASI